MRRSKLGLGAAAIVMLAAPIVSVSALGAPNTASDVAALLFEKSQWTNAPVGSSLTYAYSQKIPVKMGPSFDDKITLKLDKGDDDKSRTAEVRMFTGEHATPAGPFRSDEQNPVMLLALENNVEQLSKAWGANPRYLKNAVRKAWRENAKIENVPLTVDGKQVPGTRITIEPYKNDSEAVKMGGLETMVYTVEVADSVPGNLVRVDIHAPDSGTPSFVETLTYAGETK